MHQLKRTRTEWRLSLLAFRLVRGAYGGRRHPQEAPGRPRPEESVEFLRPVEKREKARSRDSSSSRFPTGLGNRSGLVGAVEVLRAAIPAESAQAPTSDSETSVRDLLRAERLSGPDSSGTVIVIPAAPVPVATPRAAVPSAGSTSDISSRPSYEKPRERSAKWHQKTRRSHETLDARADPGTRAGTAPGGGSRSDARSCRTRLLGFRIVRSRNRRAG